MCFDRMGSGKLSDSEKLTMKNYEDWKIVIQSVLVEKGQWMVVRSNPPAGMSDDQLKQWDELSDKAKATMVLNISSSVQNLRRRVHQAVSAKAAWDELKAFFASNFTMTELTLMKELDGLKMNPGEPAHEFAARAQLASAVASSRQYDRRTSGHTAGYESAASASAAMVDHQTAER